MESNYVVSKFLTKQLGNIHDIVALSPIQCIVAPNFKLAVSKFVTFVH